MTTILNKKILLSLGMIVFVGAAVIGATGAFFSDTETSTGNTFTAGAIDLKIDSQQHYNNAICVDGSWTLENGAGATNPQYPVIGSPCGGTWALTDLGPTNQFFNFSDIKPGDEGENTISLHVINNDAYVCAEVSGLTNDDNTQTEPEAVVDTNGLTTGELQSTMVWKVWKDDGVGEGYVAGDNVWEEGEPVLAEGNPTNGVLALYDSNTAPLASGSTTYLGVSWSLPAASGNETQTDSLTGDISFSVVQSRNNGQFVCGQGETQGPVAPVVDGVISQGEYDGALSMLITNAGGGTVKAKTQGGYLYLAADIITDTTDNRTFTGFNDEFGVNLGESPITDTVFLGLGSTNANGRTVGTIDGYFTNFPTAGHSLVALFTSGHRVIEWKIPLSVIPSIISGDTLSIGGATESTDGNSAVYPIGLLWGNNSTYGQLLVP